MYILQFYFIKMISVFYIRYMLILLDFCLYQRVCNSLKL